MSTEAMKLAIAKEALEKLAKLGNGDRYGNSIGNSIAMEALDKMAENAKELGLSYEQPAPAQEAVPSIIQMLGYCPECGAKAHHFTKGGAA